VAGAEYTSTKGNNVDAFEGNFVFGYHPDGGSALDFTAFDFDTEYSVSTPYIDASITNLFYWTNILHDITYQYGFDEAAGNFQQNNYTNVPGRGDPVVAHGQSIDRPCNASFNTQEDGVSPLMIMNVCITKDGDFDSTVMAHEYAHGLIARLTGGAVIPNCFRHAENPSEGWCDWLGIILTMKTEDTGETPRSIANYLTNQGANGGGIRPYPYSTDMNMNPLTYADVPSQIGIHKVGAIWGEILWEVTWTLIDSYGFDPNSYNFTGNINEDAGNIMALAIVTEGLKFTPCQPGFVEARDALLMAAEEIYGADVVCELWPAFAKRGLGFIADQGDSDIKGDERISFRIPLDGPIFEAEYEDFCFYGGIYEALSGGLPLGGTYSGPGVIDNGDGATYNFDPAAAGIGTHTVTYNFPETSCSPANTALKEDIVVLDDLTSPDLACLADVRVVIELEESYFLADYTDYNTVSDTCPGDVIISQSPPIGTLLEIGETEITLTARDTAGNEATCTFILTLSFVIINDEGDPRDYLTFYPNPGRELITIINTFERRIEAIEIRDMQGRLVDQFGIYNSNITNDISVEVLSSGSYFITLKFRDEDVVMRLLKR
jgi:extracellular elastinolytic metalloproteinase